MLLKLLTRSDLSLATADLLSKPLGASEGAASLHWADLWEALLSAVLIVCKEFLLHQSGKIGTIYSQLLATSAKCRLKALRFSVLRSESWRILDSCF